jgi:hypothetical protein
MERRVEKGYDEATKLYDAKLAKRQPPPSVSKGGYQLVGVINQKSNKDVTWYARKKPHNSHWTLRLVHINRDAVLRDLFTRGKIDLFAGYKNEGMGVKGGDDAVGSGEDENKINILGEYSVKERSWR